MRQKREGVAVSIQSRLSAVILLYETADAVVARKLTSTAFSYIFAKKEDEKQIL